MFIVEILIYVVFAWVMYQFAKKAELYYGKSNKIDNYLWCFLLFFTIISAIRWNVGRDSVSYLEGFKNGVVREDSKEYLWDFLVRFVHGLGLHFTVGMGIAAFAQIFFLTKPLLKNKYLLVWIPVVLFGGSYYLSMMNAVRQMIVACGFVWMSVYIVEKKPLKYFLGIFLLSLVHHSGIVLFVAYALAFIPFGRIRLERRRVLCLICFLVCFLIGQTPAYQKLAVYVVPFFANAGYENYSDYIDGALVGNIDESLSMGPIMISFLLIGIAIIWYSPRLAERFKKEIPCFSLWYFLAFLYSCLYFLTCNVSHMLIRPVQYLLFFQVVLLAMLLQYLYSSKRGRREGFYALIFIIWICTIVGMYKDTGLQGEFSTYKTIFFHQ